MDGQDNLTKFFKKLTMECKLSNDNKSIQTILYNVYNALIGLYALDYKELEYKNIFYNILKCYIPERDLLENFDFKEIKYDEKIENKLEITTNGYYVYYDFKFTIRKNKSRYIEINFRVSDFLLVKMIQECVKVEENIISDTLFDYLIDKIIFELPFKNSDIITKKLKEASQNRNFNFVKR